MANGRDDIRLAVGWLKHLKTRMLRRRLGADGPLSLLALWCYAAENHKDGSLAGLTDDQIEEAAEWPGPRGALVEALRDIGWLDGSELHDWADEQPFVAHSAERVERAKRAGEARAASAERVAGRFQRVAGRNQRVAGVSTSGSLENTSGSPAPSPSPPETESAAHEAPALTESKQPPPVDTAAIEAGLAASARWRAQRAAYADSRRPRRRA